MTNINNKINLPKSSGTQTTNSSGTLTINGQTLTNSTSTIYTIKPQITTFKLFDSEISIEGNWSLEIPIILANIECNGWKFYESITRNNISFGNELQNWLDKLYQQNKRDGKIEEILETKAS